MLLALTNRRLGIAEKLARAFPDGREPSRIVHGLADMIRARVFAIACGYEDGNDLDRLHSDPTFKLACGRLPDTGRDLCSQPTVSRLENAPDRREVIHVYDTEPSRPVSVVLRPGKTPVGVEVRAHCVVWSGTSAGVGRRRASRFVATAITPARRR